MHIEALGNDLIIIYLLGFKRVTTKKFNNTVINLTPDTRVNIFLSHCNSQL